MPTFYHRGGSLIATPLCLLISRPDATYPCAVRYASRRAVRILSLEYHGGHATIALRFSHTPNSGATRGYPASPAHSLARLLSALYLAAPAKGGTLLPPNKTAFLTFLARRARRVPLRRRASLASPTLASDSLPPTRLRERLRLPHPPRYIPHQEGQNRGLPGLLILPSFQDCKRLQFETFVPQLIRTLRTLLSF